MTFESAEVFMVVIVPVLTLFLFMPFVIAVFQLTRVWRDNHGTGFLLAAVIFWTVLVYSLLLSAFGGLAVSGSQAQWP